MTEWALQEHLARAWSDGAFDLAGRSVRLIAWEVMVPSWQINDATSSWGEPAIDFLGVSSRGGLLAIELKPRRGGTMATAQAAAQALASAATIGGTATPARLRSVFERAQAGALGRTPLGVDGDLDTMIRGHTGGHSLDVVCTRPVEAIVAYGGIARRGSEALDRDDIVRTLAGSDGRVSRRMRDRLTSALIRYSKSAVDLVAVAPLEDGAERFPADDVEAGH
ncbi:hypothetical protein [Demequina phytophila]|uniref:hypothetical protein n=1 Tax=Demequina phytophila TaxID=1638981 RepID=UPI00078167F2|nr:hypothetical protein [Demequina phytophila]